MTKPPAVSIVMIFFNAERFIGEALDSIASQNFDDWELIAVDDGSADGGPELVRRFAHTMRQPVQLLQHTGGANRGMSASRNLGASHSNGRYLAFLDADDVWLPNKLSDQIALLDREIGADALYGRTKYWSSWPGSGRHVSADYIPDLGFEAGSLVKPPSLLRNLYPLGKFAAPSMSNLIIRRDAYARTGGFEDAFKGHYEDQAFLAKLYSTCTVLLSDKVWDLYRQHDGSCSAQVQKAKSYDIARKQYLEWLSETLSQKRSQDTELNNLVARALDQYRRPVRHRFSRRKERLMGTAFELTRNLARTYLPDTLRQWAWRRIRGLTRRPPVGLVRFGSLRRLTPISSDWGEDRGRPIDRFYIERFLEQRKDDVRGHVLEIQENDYTIRFGADRVTISDVLSVAPGNPRATIIADLTDAPNIPDDTFDCVLVTQTLQLVYDVRAAMRTVHRILRPGGVMLATLPGITKIARDDVDDWCAQWHFSEPSARRLVGEVFGIGNVQTTSHGNVLAAISFLHGLAISELKKSELEHEDRDFPLVITVRAVKSGPAK